MNKLTEKKAECLLKKYAPDKDSFEKVYKHSKAVQELALEIAKKARGTDLEFIRIASLLHDIGRFECPPKKGKTILHGIRGAEILRKEGLDERFALVCERHLGAGITKEDIKKNSLPLPDKDFVPESKEEKIIAYADNLISGHKRIRIQDAIKRFRKEIGEECACKIKSLHKEIIEMQRQDGPSKNEG